MRHQDDARVNSKPTLRLDRSRGQFVEVPWSALTVGDVVKVHRGQEFPADLLFLAAGHEDPEQRGLCHVQTAQLDGETNLKLRQAPDALWPRFNSDEDVATWKQGLLLCEQPTEFFNRFNGTLYLDMDKVPPAELQRLQSCARPEQDRPAPGGPQPTAVENNGEEGAHRHERSSSFTLSSPAGGTAPVPLEASATLLRGCVLKNVDYIYGLVVYTGNETKVRVKQSSAVHKTAAVEKEINRAIIALFLYQIALCVAGTVGYWLSDAQDQGTWYLGRGIPGVDGTVTVGSGIAQALTFFLLLSSLIPISLIVTMRLARVVQKWFMERDRAMVYLNESALAASGGEEGIYPLRVRSMDLNDELGQISHIFSDKTGTLTSNYMEFRKLSVGGCVYGRGTTLVGLARRKRAGEDTAELEKALLQGAEDEKRRLAATPHVNFMDGVEGGSSRAGAGDAPVARRLLGPEGDLLGSGAHANPEQALLLRLFMLQLALNHTVLVENVHDRSSGIKTGTALSASSPDEEAFVLAGAFMGLRFTGRQRDILTLEANPALMQTSEEAFASTGLPPRANGESQAEQQQQRCQAGPGGVTLRYRVLALLPYTQARKMMSIVVEDYQAPYPTDPSQQGDTSAASERDPREIDTQSSFSDSSSEADDSSSIHEGSDAEGKGETGASSLRVPHERRPTLQQTGTASASTGGSEEEPGQETRIGTLQPHRYLLLSKGADVKIMSKLRASALAAGDRSPMPGGGQRSGAEGRGEPSDAELKEAESTAATQQAMQDWAADGLRTLAFAYKPLGTRQLKRWLNKYTSALGDLSARKAQDAHEPGNVIDALQDEMESDMLLLGATANEDKLQEGVPQTIEAIANAGIRLYMLTGDKQETALNIAFAARMLNEDFEQLLYTSEALAAIDRTDDDSATGQGALIGGRAQHLHVNGARQGTGEGSAEKGAEADVQVSTTAQVTILPSDSCEQAQKKASPWEAQLPLMIVAKARELALLAKQSRETSRPLALVLDEPALDILLQADDRVRAATVAVAEACQTVVCCRCRPDQKKFIVELIKSHVKGARTLAIGDGANDVDMILTAHVGVGIAGAEGVQAANASDYAVGRFRYLQRLLLLHGHWNYHRMAILVLYMFWKNVCFALSQFPLIPFSGWSGQRFYVDVLSQTFNLVYTSLPILVAAVLDKDVSERAAMTFPYIYTDGPARRKLNTRKLLLFIIEGTWVGIVLFLWGWLSLRSASRFGASPYLFEWGTWLFNAVTLAVNIRIALMVSEHSVIFIASVILSLLFLVPFEWIVDSINADYCKGCMQLVYGRAGYWAAYFPALAVALGPVALYKIYRRWYRPSYRNLVLEWEVVAPASQGTASVKHSRASAACYRRILTFLQPHPRAPVRPSAQDMLDIMDAQQMKSGAGQHPRQTTSDGAPGQNTAQMLEDKVPGPLGLMLLHPEPILSWKQPRRASALTAVPRAVHQGIRTLAAALRACVRRCTGVMRKKPKRRTLSSWNFAAEAEQALLPAGGRASPSIATSGPYAAATGAVTAEHSDGQSGRVIVQENSASLMAPPPARFRYPSAQALGVYPAPASRPTSSRWPHVSAIPAQEDVGQDLQEWPHAVRMAHRLRLMKATGASEDELSTRRLAMLHTRLLALAEAGEGASSELARTDSLVASMKGIQHVGAVPVAVSLAQETAAEEVSLAVSIGEGGRIAGVGQAATAAPATTTTAAPSVPYISSVAGVTAEPKARVPVPTRPAAALVPPSREAVASAVQEARAVGSVGAQQPEGAPGVEGDVAEEARERRKRWAALGRTLSTAELMRERATARRLSTEEGGVRAVGVGVTVPGPGPARGVHGRAASTSDFSVDTGPSMSLLSGLLSTAGRLSIGQPATFRAGHVGAMTTGERRGRAASDALPTHLPSLAAPLDPAAGRRKFDFGLGPPKRHKRGVTATAEEAVTGSRGGGAASGSTARRGTGEGGVGGARRSHVRRATVDGYPGRQAGALASAPSALTGSFARRGLASDEGEEITAADGEQGAPRQMPPPPPRETGAGAGLAPVPEEASPPPVGSRHRYSDTGIIHDDEEEGGTEGGRSSQ